MWDLRWIAPFFVVPAAVVACSSGDETRVSERPAGEAGAGSAAGAGSSPDEGGAGGRESSEAGAGGAGEEVQAGSGGAGGEPGHAYFCDGEPLVAAGTDVLFVVDTSESWNTRADRYAGLADAVGEFLDEHAEAHEFGALMFPRFDDAGELCDAEGYEAIDYPFGAPPEELTNAVGAAAFQGQSSLGPALAGALLAAGDHDRRATVVLLTDATPGTDEACESSDWDEVAGIAAVGFAEGRGARTHVVSVIGSGGVLESHFGRLGNIANSGGGYVAFVNGSQADVAKSSRQALEDIVDLELGCTFELPGGAAPDALELRFATGEPFYATLVEGPAACQGAGYYVDDAEDARRGMLCRGASGNGGFCEVMVFKAREEGWPDVRACQD